MGNTGYAYDSGMLAHHDPLSHDHPEQPGRLVSIMERLEQTGLLDKVVRIPMSLEDVNEISLVHAVKYHESMLLTSRKAHSSPDLGLFDAPAVDVEMEDAELTELASRLDSVYLCKDSARAALLAAGSTVALSKAIASGQVSNGFAFVRPPGHHAEQEHAMGFCIYNNVAIATKALIKAKLARRVLIVDWDVHHGNGTQNAFISDSQVLFISIHRHDNGRFYPHSAAAGLDCVGEGLGEGKTINIPWPTAGFGDADYLHAFSRVVMPVALEFDPDFVFVSAGFDAAVGDPIGECLVTPAGFSHMTHLLKGLAGGRLALVLEGGYNVKAVADCSEACTRVLLGESPQRLLAAKFVPSSATISVVESVIRIQSKYWESLVPKHYELPSQAASFCTPLPNVIESHWSNLCKKSFNLIPFPILEETFAAYFHGKVHVSNGLLDNPNTIVIFAHETPHVIQNSLVSTIESNVINHNNASCILSFLPLLDEAARQQTKIIDIQVPSRVWKLKQTTAASSDELELYNQFFQYLWDNLIGISQSENIYFVSNGLPNYAIGKLVDIRGKAHSVAAPIPLTIGRPFLDVERRIKGIMMFSSTLFLPIVSAEKGPWYQKTSRIYVPGTEKPLGTGLPTANVFGNCFSAGAYLGPANMSQRLLLPYAVLSDFKAFVSPY